MKRLIVNADDLGRSPGVNRGIVRGHREGIVTSATLMANAPRANEAAALARDLPRLGVGVHLVLTFAAPLSPPQEVPSLVREDARFPARPREIRGRVRGEEALVEFRRQIDRATALLGRTPTHLDTHHSVQNEPEVLWALAEIAREKGLPARQLSPAMREELRRKGIRTPDRFLPDFYGREAVTTVALLALLERLGPGTTELMCHPGEVDAELRTSSYADERALELRTLTDPAVADAVRRAGVELVDYGVV